MNEDDEFIREIEQPLPARHELTGWELVIFEVVDEDEVVDS